jgi:hypothetical protein
MAEGTGLLELFTQPSTTGAQVQNGAVIGPYRLLRKIARTRRREPPQLTHNGKIAAGKLLK